MNKRKTGLGFKFYFYIVLSLPLIILIIALVRERTPFIGLYGFLVPPLLFLLYKITHIYIKNTSDCNRISEYIDLKKTMYLITNYDKSWFIKRMNYYRDNVNLIPNRQRKRYLSNIFIILESVRFDTKTINSTDNYYVFIYTLIQIVNKLNFLILHEHVAPFENELPSEVLQRIHKNMSTYEIEFLKRSYTRDFTGRLDIPDDIYSSMSSSFTAEALAFIENNEQTEENIENEIEESLYAPIYQNFDYLDGHQFEEFCADVLKNNDYTDVVVTQGSGDQGIDVIAYKDGIKFGIQCKCYSNTVGNKAVQEAYSGAKFYDCHLAVVMTNNFFTSSAIELAQKNNVVLWDRDKLLSMIDNINN